jgi:hypothetical protein
VITSEELRVAALDASAKRGKWVAKRRVFRRWLGWVIWRIVLPVLGLMTVTTALAGLAFWQYKGHDVAYLTAQKWVQQEFGSFQSNKIQSPNRTDNTSMIPLTDEATPDLQLDRNLTIKQSPN